MVKMVPQLNVYLENEPGILAKLAEAFHRSHINIVGMCISEATEWGVLRLIVDNTRGARRIIKKLTGKEPSITSVLEVLLPNVPGALKNTAKKLSRRKININYAYATGRGNQTTLYISVSDVEKGRKALS